MISAPSDVYCRNTTDGLYTILNFNVETPAGYTVGSSVCTQSNYDAGSPAWRDIPLKPSGGYTNISGLFFPPNNNLYVWVTLRSSTGIMDNKLFLLVNGTTVATEQASVPPLTYTPPVAPTPTTPEPANISRDQIVQLITPYLTRYGLSSYIEKAADIAVAEATVQNYMPDDRNGVFDLIYNGNKEFYRDMIAAKGSFEEDFSAATGDKDNGGLFDGLGDTVGMLSKALPIILILSVIQTIKK